MGRFLLNATTLLPMVAFLWGCSDGTVPLPRGTLDSFGIITVAESRGENPAVEAHFIRTTGIASDAVGILLGDGSWLSEARLPGQCELLDRDSRMQSLVGHDVDLQLLDAGELTFSFGDTLSAQRVAPALHPDRLPFVAGVVYGPTQLAEPSELDRTHRLRVHSRGGEEVEPFSTEVPLVKAQPRLLTENGQPLADGMAGNACAEGAAPLIQLSRAASFTARYDLNSLQAASDFEEILVTLRMPMGDTVLCRAPSQANKVEMPQDLLGRLADGPAQLTVSAVKRASFHVPGFSRAEVRALRSDCVTVAIVP